MRLSYGTKHGLARLPGVWGLGFTSLFMDTSSELVHSLLPVFLASVLGASMIEPVKEGTDMQSIFFDMWRQDHPDAALEDVSADLVTASGSGPIRTSCSRTRATSSTGSPPPGRRIPSVTWPRS